MNALRYCAAATAVLATGIAVADRIDIVSEAQAARFWQPDPNATRYVAGYPDTARNKSRDVCVSIGYLIKADGTTSNYTQMSAWGNGNDGSIRQSDAQPYVQVAAAVVSRWKFVPVVKPHSIYTSATFAFDGSKALGEDAIRGQCRIDDLPTFVAQAKMRADDRGDLNRRRADAVRMGQN
jgi:hypothetical protein